MQIFLYLFCIFIDKVQKKPPDFTMVKRRGLYGVYISEGGEKEYLFAYFFYTQA